VVIPSMRDGIPSWRVRVIFPPEEVMLHKKVGSTDQRSDDNLTIRNPRSSRVRIQVHTTSLILNRVQHDSYDYFNIQINSFIDT
jgi:hypothetical protein